MTDKQRRLSVLLFTLLLAQIFFYAGAPSTRAEVSTTPETSATSTSVNSTMLGGKTHSHHDGSRYWKFCFDGTNFVGQSSTDRVNWNAKVTLVSSPSKPYVAIACVGTVIHMAYGDYASTSTAGYLNVHMHYRRGVIAGATTITLDAERTLFNWYQDCASGTSLTFTLDVRFWDLTLGTDNLITVVWSRNGLYQTSSAYASRYVYSTIKSTATDGSAWGSIADIESANSYWTDDTNQVTGNAAGSTSNWNTRTRPLIAPLTSATVWCVENKGGSVTHRKSSAWTTTIGTIDASAKNTDSWGSIVGKAANNYAVIAYVDSDDTIDLYWYDGTTTASQLNVFAATKASPSIALRNEPSSSFSLWYLFAVNSTHNANRRVYSSSTADTRDLLLASGQSSVAFFSTQRTVLNGELLAIWQTGASSPYAVNFASVNAPATSTSSSALAFGGKTHTHWDGTRYWIFYFDGTNFVGKSSTDGVQWPNAPITLVGPCGGNNQPKPWVALSCVGTTIHMAYGTYYTWVGVGVYYAYLYYRRGTITSATSITLDTERMVYNTAVSGSSGYKHWVEIRYFDITVGTDNLLTIGFAAYKMYNSTGTNAPESMNYLGVIKSTAADGSSWGSSQAIKSNYWDTWGSGNTYWYNDFRPLVAPLASAKVVCYFNEDGGVYRCESSAWSSIITIDSSAGDMDNWGSLTGGDGGGKVACVYRDSDNTFDVQWYDGSVSSNDADIFSSSTSPTVCALNSTNGLWHFFVIRDISIVKRTCSGYDGTWQANSTVFSYQTTPSSLSSARTVLNAYVLLAWSSSVTPYVVQFGTVYGLPPTLYTVSLSETITVSPSVSTGTLYVVSLSQSFSFSVSLSRTTSMTVSTAFYASDGSTSITPTQAVASGTDLSTVTFVSANWTSALITKQTWTMTSVTWNGINIAPSSPQSTKDASGTWSITTTLYKFTDVSLPQPFYIGLDQGSTSAASYDSLAQKLSFTATGTGTKTLKADITAKGKPYYIEIAGQRYVEGYWTYTSATGILSFPITFSSTASVTVSWSAIPTTGGDGLVVTPPTPTPRAFEILLGVVLPIIEVPWLIPLVILIILGAGAFLAYRYEEPLIAGLCMIAFAVMMMNFMFAFGLAPINFLETNLGLLPFHLSQLIWTPAPMQIPSPAIGLSQTLQLIVLALVAIVPISVIAWYAYEH